MASSLLNTLQWFPIALGVHSKVLSMTMALCSLAPTYLLASVCVLRTGFWPHYSPLFLKLTKLFSALGPPNTPHPLPRVDSPRTVVWPNSSHF